MDGDVIMANVQKEHGFTPIANELMEALSKTKLNGTQYRILLTILRSTYGYNKKSHQMSDSYISKATGINQRQINREIQSLIKMNIVRLYDAGNYTQGRVIGIQKDYTVWKTLDKKNTTVILDSTDNIDGTDILVENLLSNQSVGVLSNQSDKKDIYKDNKTNIYIVIFDYWNSKKIITHRKLTDKLKQRIKTTLDDYTKEEVCKAIDNYSDIINDDKYYFSYKWTLKDFLQRGLEKFLDDSCHSNYLKQEYKEKKQLEGIKPNPEYLRMKEMLNNGNS